MTDLNQMPANNDTTPAADSGGAGSNNTTETNPSWLPDRLERAKRSAISDLLKQVGVESVDALKAIVKPPEPPKQPEPTPEKPAAKAEKTAKASDELAELKDLIKQIVDERKAEKAEAAKVTRAQIAAKYGLPEALAARLQGNDAAELEADAKTIAAALPKPQAKMLQSSIGNGAAGEAEPDMTKAILEHIRGNGLKLKDTFLNPDVHNALGGGVFINGEKIE